MPTLVPFLAEARKHFFLGSVRSLGVRLSVGFPLVWNSSTIPQLLVVRCIHCTPQVDCSPIDHGGGLHTNIHRGLIPVFWQHPVIAIYLTLELQWV